MPNTNIVKLESSKDIAPVKQTMQITGLEDIPTNMIPIPFYKLVQPGSTNVTLSDGVDAVPGTIYMKDSGKSVPTFNFALIRAKRQHRQFTNDNGEVVNTTSIGLLGMNLENYAPFILNVSLASFSGFGQFLKQLKDKKVVKAWEYPVTLTSTKREETKIIGGRTQKVKYWVLNFIVGGKKLSDEDISTIDKAYNEFASTLDRQNTEEDLTASVENPKQIVELAKEVAEDEASLLAKDNGEKVNPDAIPF